MRKELKNELFKKIILDLNKILRQKSAAGAGMEFLMKFPVEFKIVKVNSDFESENNDKGKDAYAHLRAYTMKGVQWKLFIEFLQYKNEKEKDVERYIKYLSNQHLAVIYLHEVQHIIRLHLTDAVDSKMKSIIKKFKPEMPESAMHPTINIAEDFAINWAIREITDSPKEFFEFGMYKKEFHDEKLNEYQILEKMLEDENFKINTSTMSLSGNQNNQSQDQSQNGQGQDGQNQGQNSQDQSQNGQGQDQSDQNQSQDQNQNGQGEIKITKIEYDGKTIYSDIEASKQASKTSDESQEGSQNGKPSDSELADLVQQLSQTMKDALEKGNFPNHIKGHLLPEVPVNVDWVKKLKKSLKNLVNYNSQDYYSNWKNLNNKLRHIAKFPKHEHIENNINLYLSIDQSGSMSDEDLGKILYAIKKISKQLKKITVLIHDTDIAAVYESKEVPTLKELREFIGKRVACGGTSHQKVFEYLDQIKIDPDQRPIYISYSDNYSDIDEYWSSFKNKKNFVGMYFIAPKEGSAKIKAGGAIKIFI